MLPVARKPIVQYVVEELAANGVTQMVFVTGRSKTSIENHFDSDPELARVLKANNRHQLLDDIRFDDLNLEIFYTRQRVQRGLGDAVLCGEHFVGERPFVLALGDSIIGLHGQSNAISRMTQIFESRLASAVIAVEEVSQEETSHYGIIQPAEGEGDCMRVLNLVEKPDPKDAPSNLAIAGRYILSPLIFDLIRQIKPDRRGEIQLTDAIQRMCEEGKRVLAFKLPKNERRYDIGNFPSYYQTFVEFALADPDYGEEFAAHLRRILAQYDAERTAGVSR